MNDVNNFSNELAKNNAAKCLQKSCLLEPLECTININTKEEELKNNFINIALLIFMENNIIIDRFSEKNLTSHTNVLSSLL
jgi:hypothetical protein